MAEWREEKKGKRFSRGGKIKNEKLLKRCQVN